MLRFILMILICFVFFCFVKAKFLFFTLAFILNILNAGHLFLKFRFLYKCLELRFKIFLACCLVFHIKCFTWNILYISDQPAHIYRLIFPGLVSVNFLMQTRRFCSFTDTIRDFHRNNICCVINFIKCCVCYGLYLLNIVLIRCYTCYGLYFLSTVLAMCRIFRIQHLLYVVFFESPTLARHRIFRIQHLLCVVFFEYCSHYVLYLHYFL